MYLLLSFLEAAASERKVSLDATRCRQSWRRSSYCRRHSTCRGFLMTRVLAGDRSSASADDDAKF